MPSNLADKGQSIVEASLTELAFIFFFILFVFSSLKINSLIESSDFVEEEKRRFAEQHNIMRESLELPKVDMEAPFEGVSETTLKVTQLASTVKDIERQLNNLPSSELKDKIEIISRIEEKYGSPSEILDAIEKAVEDKSPFDKFPQYLEDLKVQLDNAKGQNQNMRERLKKLGNGLVYPPCWADVNTGAIEYIYNVIINENSIIVTRAWPDSREELVLRTPHIMNALGEYNINSEFLEMTRALFVDSKENKCRHFVRIIDEAISKDAFKKQLLTIEHHFYKYLVP